VQLDAADGGGFLITPTDACLGYLDPARLSKLDDHGQHLSGGQASKTIALHRQIYAASVGTAAPARCVIHSHSSHCVALSLQSPQPAPLGPELLPALTPYFVMKVGHVPLIDYQRPGDPVAAQKVAAAIAAYAARAKPIRAVMLERLGPNVWHDSPSAAMAVLEELEETAKLWLLNRQQAAPLTAAQIEDLRKTFGAVW
jgi:ribulose-5-phosphate 4-epimerase/fuculose-1-phosphate aldolase